MLVPNNYGLDAYSLNCSVCIGSGKRKKDEALE